MMVCKGCNKRRRESSFYKDKTKKTGYGSKCKDCHKAYVMARYQETKHLITPEKRERMREHVRNWALRNPEYLKLHIANKNSKRRAKVKVGVSTKKLNDWFQSEEKICAYCGDDCTSNPHIDHIIPLSRGGKHTLKNLAIACAPCNLSKHNKLPSEWEGRPL